MEDEVRELKRKLRNLNYKYDDLLLQFIREGNRYKRLEEKYNQTVKQFENMVRYQAELGIELEGRIRELEGAKNE